MKMSCRPFQPPFRMAFPNVAPILANHPPHVNPNFRNFPKDISLHPSIILY